MAILLKHPRLRNPGLSLILLAPLNLPLLTLQASRSRDLLPQTHRSRTIILLLLEGYPLPWLSFSPQESSFPI